MAPTLRDPSANLGRLAVAVREARGRGATILVTPELTLSGYDVGDLGDDLTSPTLLAGVQDVARSSGLTLVVGMALREGDGTSNAAVIVDSSGGLRATYRKAHLFRDLDASRFRPGPHATAVAEVDGVRVACVICYDIEFPETARAAALGGAHVLAVPTANMSPWEVVNESVIPARAFENQLYVAYANHIAAEGNTSYVGRSVIAAPDGSTERAGPDEETIIVMPFDTDDIERRRQEATHLADRRPALYHRVTEADV